MQHGGVVTSPHSSTNLKQLMHISTEFFHRRTHYEGGEHTVKGRSYFFWTDGRFCFDDSFG